MPTLDDQIDSVILRSVYDIGDVVYSNTCVVGLISFHSVIEVQHRGTCVATVSLVDDHSAHASFTEHLTPITVPYPGDTGKRNAKHCAGDSCLECYIHCQL